MLAHTPGKIFLADQRGLTETRSFRRFATLNFGDFCQEHKQPLGSLLAVNEETLAGGATLTLPVPAAVHIVLLPVTGTVAVLLPTEVRAVEVAQVQVLTLPAGSALRLRNPYPSDLISLLHLWVRADEPAPAIGPAAAFSLAALTNRLAPLLPTTAGLPFALHLGRFAGRHEAAYALLPGRLFFGFVLAGAFEAEGRLLHEKDGLALWDAPTPVEVEALSNDALLLVLEVAA
jgi:redox-sensitive bicupin YhaK (pirin superfamily)